MAVMSAASAELLVAWERSTTEEAVMMRKVSPRRMSGLASALEEKKKSSLRGWGGQGVGGCEGGNGVVMGGRQNEE